MSGLSGRGVFTRSHPPVGSTESLTVRHVDGGRSLDTASPPRGPTSLRSLVCDREQGVLERDHLLGRADRHPQPPVGAALADQHLSLIHISEPTRLGMISYAVFCLK